MIIHSLLLTLQSLAAVFGTLLPYIKVFYTNSVLITIVVTAVDLIVQLMICYICLTMGSHIHLRNFQMTLDLTTGVPKVVFSYIRESIFDSEIEAGELVDD
jgi:hypothetical protein